jgi:two-component system cell cycle sensor histidine kinase PleC
MFNTIRYIALVALAVVLPLAIFVSYYLRSHIEESVILRLAEDQSTAAAHGFSGAVWQRYAPSLQQLPCREEPCPDTSKFYAALDQDIKDYFDKLNVIKYNIYFASGEKVVSEERFDTDVTLDKKSELAFIGAQYGKTQSVLLKGYMIGGLPYNVVRTFVPIFSGAGVESKSRVEGVAEVFYDITPMWKSPGTWQFLGLGLFGGMLVFTLGFMFVVARSAEKIITKQHEVTEELTQAKASAEEENQAKSRFLANVSHELRTPLNAIIGFSEILKDEVMGPVGNQQYKEYSKDIYSSGVHLLSLINDILDFSKAEAGKLEVQIADVDVNKILRSSMRLVEPRAMESEVKLIEDLPKDHVVVKTDAKRLKQVVLNMLSNSVKFTPSGGSVTLHARAVTSDKQFIIEVRDTGVGISPKDIAKVMQTFGQAENKLSRRYEGTGLGLPLSKKLVELMNGTFDIRSKEGEGTTVTITLPYAHG